VNFILEVSCTGVKVQPPVLGTNIKVLISARPIWKAITHDFKGVGDGLAWRVGKGTKVRLGSDPWLGSGANHTLPPDLINLLNA
jgi:hypothetical protein